MAITASNLLGPLNPLDSTSGARVTIDYIHARTHEGHEYSASIYQDDLAAASALNLFITAPASGVEAHMTFSLSVDAPGRWILSDGTDASGGTALTEVNHFRSKQTSNAASTVITSDALVTSTGTILEQGLIGAAGKFSIAGGAEDSRREWIFEGGEEGIVQFIADASCRCALHAHWYEVED